VEVGTEVPLAVELPPWPCVDGEEDWPQVTPEPRETPVNPFQNVSDEDLMDYCVQGSEAAFADLVRRYKTRIVNLVYRFIRDHQRAEDLAQEVFVRVFLHRERYRKSGKFSTWIFTIAVNLAKNEIRRKVRLRNTSSLEGLQEIAGQSGFFLKDDKPAPDRDLEREQLNVLVNRAIEKLPQRYRMALVLRDIEGLSYEEIGDILQIPGGTVRSRINRARLMLKDKLKPHLRTGA
jgi:RNA polymerase sigma-70 factor (ECF subfamily)